MFASPCFPPGKVALIVVPSFYFLYMETQLLSQVMANGHAGLPTHDPDHYCLYFFCANYKEINSRFVFRICMTWFWPSGKDVKPFTRIYVRAYS